MSNSITVALRLHAAPYHCPHCHVGFQAGQTVHVFVASSHDATDGAIGVCIDYWCSDHVDDEPHHGSHYVGEAAL